MNDQPDPLPIAHALEWLCARQIKIVFNIMHQMKATELLTGCL